MSTKNIIISTASFIIGSAAGFALGYFISKNKYLNMAEKEISSVKKVYEKHFMNVNAKNDNDEKSTTASDVTTHTEENEKKKYKNYAAAYNGSESKEVTVTNSIDRNDKPSIPKPKKHVTPYVISPDEYRDSPYEAQTLIWYADKILTDDDGNVIHNINEVIGPEALSTFGRYEDDAVYVRDDENKIDYEIIWNPKKFSSTRDEDL